MEKKTTKFEPPFLLKKVPDLPYFQTCGKEQGEFTLEDYYQTPEGYLTELIDGEFYDMPTPTWIHQQAIIFVLSELNTFIKSNSIPFQNSYKMSSITNIDGYRQISKYEINTQSSFNFLCYFLRIMVDEVNFFHF